MLIDTHTHLFLEEYATDLPQVIDRAKSAGIGYLFMPNIDRSTLPALLDVCARYTGYCFPMLGLHPTSVTPAWEEELASLRPYLDEGHGFVAIGEIGLDLYWDSTYLQEQLLALETQLNWALEYDLPVVIHCRNAFEPMYSLLSRFTDTPLRGIFHSFEGTAEQAILLLGLKGFLLGVNGIVTFKKSTLPQVLPHIPLTRIVLETDSPYLTPVPHRGKRNESAYIRHTLEKVASVYQTNPDDVAAITTRNAMELFKISE